jgi:hypothetical protein
MASTPSPRAARMIALGKNPRRGAGFSRADPRRVAMDLKAREQKYHAVSEKQIERKKVDEKARSFFSC